MPDPPLRKWCHVSTDEHLHYFTAKGPLCGKALVATREMYVSTSNKPNPTPGKKPPLCRECERLHTLSWKKNIDPN